MRMAHKCSSQSLMMSIIGFGVVNASSGSDPSWESYKIGGLEIRVSNNSMRDVT